MSGRLNLSIHGRFKDGKQAGQLCSIRYNDGKYEPEISQSPRAKRRRERKANKK